MVMSTNTIRRSYNKEATNDEPPYPQTQLVGHPEHVFMDLPEYEAADSGVTEAALQVTAHCIWYVPLQPASFAIW